MDAQAHRPRIVIIGGGFGGLAAIGELKGTDAAITLIDKRNHHLFQPLLYQVATTSLGPSEIAWPIRQLVHKRPEVTTLMGKVAGVDTARGVAGTPSALVSKRPRRTACSAAASNIAAGLDSTTWALPARPSMLSMNSTIT